MRRQIIAAKTEGLSGDVIAAVATSGVAFNVSSRSGYSDTVNLTFSHCVPRFRRHDLMHLGLDIHITNKESVEDIFNIVNHYIGGVWKTEKSGGSFAKSHDDMAASFGRSQILDDFIPANYAWTYLKMIEGALPQFKSDFRVSQFPLRRELAAATCFDTLKHTWLLSNRKAKDWVSCLRDAGLSEHQIGQWSTLLCETSTRFDPTDRSSFLSKSIQDAAAFLTSEDVAEESEATWKAKKWNISAVDGIQVYAPVHDARSANSLVKRLSSFQEAKLEDPPYKESLSDVVKKELWSLGRSAAMMTAGTAAAVTLCNGIADALARSEMTCEPGYILKKDGVGTPWLCLEHH